MSDSVEGAPARAEAQVRQTNASASASEPVAELGELHAAALARTQLLLQLFPHDAGASVLPSAESTLGLPDMVTISDEGSGDQVTIWEIKTRSAEDSDAASQMWHQLMSYVDSLTKAVQSGQDRPIPDRNRVEELGSEQPIPE